MRRFEVIMYISQLSCSQVKTKFALNQTELADYMDACKIAFTARHALGFLKLRTFFLK